MHKAYQPIGTTLPNFVENVRAALASPGEFYFDYAKQVVMYYPRDEEEVAMLHAGKLEAVLPIEQTLVEHAGGAAHHRWEGVAFQYATWLMPMQNEGFVESQTGFLNVCPIGSVSPYFCN